MSGVTWQFYRGIDTIGGTVISIIAGEHRLIFDMGRIFNPSIPIFDAQIQSRGIVDLQRLGIAPVVPGIFEGDGTEAPDNLQTMVAISHSHLDHIGLLPYLQTDIPVLLTQPTYQLIQALDAVADGPRRALQYQPVDFDETVEFGPFRITPVSVDHDTPGACAFFIETPELRFIYSGDLRLHGAYPQLTRHFAQRGHVFKPDVLFIEGTRAQSEDNTDIIFENDLAGRLTAAVQACDKGVYFTFYPRHPERVNAFLTAAQNTGRKLVLHPASAFIYTSFHGELPTEHVCLYGVTEAEWTPALRDWVSNSGLQLVYPVDVKGFEHQFIIEMAYRRLVDWVDINAQPGGLFIHSNGTPLGPYDPSWNNLMYWLDAFGLEFQYLGSTGHGSRGDILAIVEEIAPRVLMPIHSLHPGRIGLKTIPRIMPSYQVVYTKGDLNLAVPPTDEELDVPVSQS